MTYVNYLGDEIGLIDHGRAPKPKKEESSYHNGWRVQGIPPGALEEAERRHPQLIADAKSWNERVASGNANGKAVPVPGPWDADKWLNDAKRKPVRSKPYGVEAAAHECKALAERSGWLRVEVVELKKEVRKEPA